MNLKNINHQISLLLIICVGVCSGMKAIAQEFDGYQWETLKCKGEPAARHEAASIEAKGKFYLMGGCRIQEVSIFDPETNYWASGAKPPLELHHFQGFSYNGNIYVAGAMTGKYPHETALPYMYIYQPETDTWVKGPEIPADRLRGSA